MAESGNDTTGNSSSSITTKYYCYQCKGEVQLSSNNSELKCPNCQEGFLEEIETENENAGSSTTRTSHHTFPSFPPLFNMLGALGRPPGGGGANMFAEPIIFNMRHRPQGGQGPQGVQLVFNGIGNRQASPSQQMPVEFNSLFNLLSNMGGLNFGMSEVHGNPGDYAWGAGALDTIITQLLNSVDGAGPPPADSATIEGLPSVKITAAQVENGIQCFVCFDEFALDEEVKVLPCKHHYHRDCIVPWLERHGTCPVCRKDLQGSDTTTTEFDANIGETLSSIEQHTGADSANSSASQNRNNSALRSRRHRSRPLPGDPPSQYMDDDIE